MAINVLGMPLSINAPQWARLFEASDLAGGTTAIPSGLTVTLGAGTRELRVAAGSSYQVGTLLTSDAVVSRTYGVAPATGARIDRVCAQVDWAGDVATAGSIVIVPGVAAATPQVPTVQQVAGTRWQTPLARVRVPATGTPTITPEAGVATATDFVPLTLPGAWSAVTDAPLGVQNLGGRVEFTGRYTRTTNDMPVGTLAEFDGAAVIPVGFRPVRVAQTSVYFGTSGIGKIIVQPTGLMSLTIVNATLSAGTAFRVANTTWIAA